MNQLHLLLLLCFFFGSYSSRAQSPNPDADSVQVADSLAVFPRPARTYGFWVAGYLEPAYAAEINGINGGFGGAFVYREQFYVGFYGATFMGNYESRLIFPNQFTFNYSHAGLWTGYKSGMGKRVEFIADLKIGEGRLFWERNDNFYNQFEDYALFMIPSVGADVKLFKFLAIHGAVGYRAVFGMEVPAFSNEDFSGINLQLMLKTGLF